MTAPVVSVIIPTYNRRDYLQEAIDSVLAQTFTNFEIIVVDDGSTDGTGEALEQRYGDRIRYEWQENQGESAARNRGIKMAQGEFIALLDSDDMWLPTKLERQVASMREHPSTGMVTCRMLTINGQGRLIAGKVSDAPCAAPITWEQAVTGSCPGLDGASSAVMIRRDVFSELGVFDTEIKYGEDTDLWMRIADRYDVYDMGMRLLLFRRHGSQQTSYSTQAEIARALDDRLRLLGNAASYRSDPASEALLQRATAREFVLAYLRELAASSDGHALEYLGRARDTGAEMLSCHLLPDFVAERALAVARRSREYSVASAADYATKALSGLVSHCISPSRRLVSKTKGQVFATLAHDAHGRGANREARTCCLRAIAHDPRWIRDRGILSIYVKDSLAWQRLSVLRRENGKRRSEAG